MKCGDKEDEHVHRVHAMACDKSSSAGLVWNGGKKRMSCWD